MIGVMNVESAGELDRIVMTSLPISHHPEFKQVISVREYTSFAEDIRRRRE